MRNGSWDEARTCAQATAVRTPNCPSSFGVAYMRLYRISETRSRLSTRAVRDRFENQRVATEDSQSQPLSSLLGLSLALSRLMTEPGRSVESWMTSCAAVCVSCLMTRAGHETDASLLRPQLVATGRVCGDCRISWRRSRGTRGGFGYSSPLELQPNTLYHSRLPLARGGSAPRTLAASAS